jgi:NADPH:quinone reductase-like Zn-dependent oxidoreductase
VRSVIVSKVNGNEDGERTFPIEDISVVCRHTELPDPVFDPADPDNEHHVLVRVCAFSCNYRDLSMVYHLLKSSGDGATTPFGSEFSGEVVAVGRSVKTLAVGDMVSGDYSYPEPRAVQGVDLTGVLPGVPTNNASRELAVFHEAKLRKMPPGVSVETAAAFALNAQTVYAMVRRLSLSAGDAVLVTAGRSNVALFAMQLLSLVKTRTVVVTTSPSSVAKLEELGLARVVLIERPVGNLLSYPTLREITRQSSGFVGVIDPLSDVYLLPVLVLMAIGGRYITCGSAHQLPRARHRHRTQAGGMGELYEYILLKNICVAGNCIGVPDDIDRAMADLRAGSVRVVVDSTYGTGNEMEFFERTFFDPERFGKVIYRFD